MAVLPRVGERFGRYRIDTQIGRGGMGVVFGATDLTFGRTVALKVVSAALGDSSEFTRRFEREAAVLARLDSPHVIAIFDYGVEDDCPYIATQYVRGGDLGGLLRTRGPMPPALALAVCAQVADALHDAHRVGVVHRDVKPGNVLLRDADVAEPHAYLCDFGIARTATEGLTTPGSVAGTWSYLSPECGRGAPGTASSDIYALGCLLWVMLTGAPPYRGSDIEIAVAHQQAPVVQLRGDDEATARLNEVLARSMAKQPHERYATADDLRRAVLGAAALAPSTITPRPGSTPASPAPLAPAPVPAPGRRRRTGLAAALVGLGVLVVGGAAVAATQVGGGGAAPTPAPTSGTVSSGTGSGGTTGQPVASGPVTGDLDGDHRGDLTLRYGDDAAQWTSDGTAFVAGPETTLPPDQVATLRGDVDGDGAADVLTVTGARGTYAVAGTLSGGAVVDTTWHTPATLVPVPVAADLDADGDDDVLVRLRAADGGVQRATGLMSALSDGAGDFTDLARVAGPVTLSPQARYVVGDFDGDRRADLARVVDKGFTDQYEERYDVTVLTGDGTTFTAGQPRSLLAACCDPPVVAADLDGDGDDELVVVVPDAGVPILSLDLHDGRLGSPTPVGAVPGVGDGQRAGSLAAETSDVDGDGRDDVVVVGRLDAQQAVVKVALSSGTGPGDVVLSAIKWASWTHAFVDGGHLVGGGEL